MSVKYCGNPECTALQYSAMLNACPRCGDANIKPKPTELPLDHPLRRVVDVLRSCAKGASDSGGVIGCSDDALNSWANEIEQSVTIQSESPHHCNSCGGGMPGSDTCCPCPSCTFPKVKEQALTDTEKRLLLDLEARQGSARPGYDDIRKINNIIYRLSGWNLPHCSDCNATLLEEEYKGDGIPVRCTDCVSEK